MAKRIRLPLEEKEALIKDALNHRVSLEFVAERAGISGMTLRTCGSPLLDEYRNLRQEDGRDRSAVHRALGPDESERSTSAGEGRLRMSAKARGAADRAQETLDTIREILAGLPRGKTKPRQERQEPPARRPEFSEEAAPDVAGRTCNELVSEQLRQLGEFGIAVCTNITFYDRDRLNNHTLMAYITAGVDISAKAACLHPAELDLAPAHAECRARLIKEVETQMKRRQLRKSWISGYYDFAEGGQVTGTVVFRMVERDGVRHGSECNWATRPPMDDRYKGLAS